MCPGVAARGEPASNTSASPSLPNIPSISAVKSAAEKRQIVRKATERKHSCHLRKVCRRESAPSPVEKSYSTGCITRAMTYSFPISFCQQTTPSNCQSAIGDHLGRFTRTINDRQWTKGEGRE